MEKKQNNTSRKMLVKKVQLLQLLLYVLFKAMPGHVVGPLAKFRVGTKVNLWM